MKRFLVIKLLLKRQISLKYKFVQVVASVAALTLAEPHGQFQWPGGAVVSPYGVVAESTCYGCRPHVIGKREAEPHGAGVAFHPTGVSHVGPTTFGYPGPFYYGKREAEAEPHGVAVHPYTGTSFVGRTIYGYPRVLYGKRSAEAEPHVGYGPGLAVHPGVATSYVGRTIHGLPHYGKRDAEAEPEAAPEAAADAEADADAFYGYYGYAPAAYGGFRYGWPGGYTHVSGLYGYPYWG